MEVFWERLEFRERDVAADGVKQSEHEEKDGSKEEGRDLVHSQFRRLYERQTLGMHDCCRVCLR